MEVVSTQRGKPKILYEGYEYVQSNTNITTLNWRCTKKRCNGSIATAHTFREDRQVHVKNDHSHPPAPELMEAKVVEERVLQRAMSTDMPPRRVISEEVVGVSQGGLLRIGKRTALRRKIQRKRRRRDEGEAEEIGRRDEIPEEFANAIQGCQ